MSNFKFSIDDFNKLVEKIISISLSESDFLSFGISLSNIYKNGYGYFLFDICKIISQGGDPKNEYTGMNVKLDTCYVDIYKALFKKYPEGHPLSEEQNRPLSKYAAPVSQIQSRYTITQVISAEIDL